ncbi:MAG: acetyl-CoA carboxylase biotin carboxyl carrier protein subunit [Balneolaceae bacterium]|nr:acetyl-CoA carboxylase biotin carboxyl carrier protein subunit [Balneolaceae bacterium]
MKFEAQTDGESRTLELDPETNRYTLEGESGEYRFSRGAGGRRLLRLGTKLHVIDNIEYDQRTVQFTIDGEWCSVEVRDEQDLLLDEMGFKTAAELSEGELNAPMPGKILQILVEEGDEVELGDPVAILEAMKMENELKAPTGGVVTAIAVAEGDSVEKNVLILEIEARG